MKSHDLGNECEMQVELVRRIPNKHDWTNLNERGRGNEGVAPLGRADNGMAPPGRDITFSHGKHVGDVQYKRSNRRAESL